jgi:hypothetical protein
MRARSAPGPAGRKSPSKRRSSMTEAYFRSEGPEADPLLVIYHIQKTAGTALREVVRANLEPSELEIAPDLRDVRYEPDELLTWYRDWYAALGPDRRARLACVMSHSAGYLLPALDRPVETLVLVREPVDRVMSFYWEKRRNYLRRRDRDTPFNLLERVYESPLPDRPPQAWPQFYNWQSRCLLSVFYDVSKLPTTDGPPPDADLWHKRLQDLVERVYLVGVQDRFADYVGWLARRYGWSDSFVPQSGVNKQRPPLSDVPSEVRERILATNWLDAELYALCRQAQQRREE